MSFTTPDLCDEFARHVRAAEPLFRDWGGVLTFAGAIETVKVFEDNGLVRQVLETEGRGRVLVVDGGGSVRCALVGGRLAALAHQHGWSGIVVHGCVRDSAELAGTPLGVKALHAVPMKSGKSPTVALPPLSLTTCLTTVMVGAWSSLVMVHRTDSPGESVTMTPPVDTSMALFEPI